MKIDSINLNKDIQEIYTWEYFYKGLLFFSIGNVLVWYKFGRLTAKLFMWFGKISWKILEKQNKKVSKPKKVKNEKNKTKKV
jgi:hypothetical protein